MSTVSVQAIFIRGHEQRSQPKPHIVYHIEVLASVRSWQMWRRYSEFVELHSELTRVTGSEPPASLPPKHIFSFRKNDTKIVEERRDALEAYLRAIISSKESQWRDTQAFNDFLGVPMGKINPISSSSRFTLSSWLDEQSDLQTLARDIRADINKRNSLADMGDISASHISNVQAKKKLLTLLDRLGILAKGLEALGMPDGELQRRNDMVAHLQDDCEKLGKMVVAAKQSARSATSAANYRTPASQADRAALLSSSPGASNRPATRVFGAPPQETEVTRPLDDEGLLRLQKEQMEQQGVQVSQLTAILRRQRQLGIAISDEISQQNELLDHLSENVDKGKDKLKAAEKLQRRLG